MTQALSRHCARRLQQRALSERVVDLILAYGRLERRGDGDVYQIDRRGWERMRALEDAHELNRLARKLEAYVVVADDGVLVTSAYPRRRLRHARTTTPWRTPHLH